MLNNAADIRRDDRPLLKKAGNLRYAFARTSGELIVVFDADFCPRPDFFHESLPYFADPSIGLVQTPQFFRRSDEQTWVEQGAGVVQELFYRLIQVGCCEGEGSSRQWCTSIHGQGGGYCSWVNPPLSGLRVLPCANVDTFAANNSPIERRQRILG